MILVKSSTDDEGGGANRKGVVLDKVEPRKWRGEGPVEKGVTSRKTIAMET